MDGWMIFDLGGRNSHNIERYSTVNKDVGGIFIRTNFRKMVQTAGTFNVSRSKKCQRRKFFKM